LLRPESCLWGDTDFEKLRNNGQGFLKYIPLWSLEDLITAQPILRPDMSKDQVKQRYHLFGGVPENIFMSDRSAADMLKYQDAALGTLSPQEMESIAVGEMDALNKFEYGSSKSELLAYVPSPGDNNTFTEF
jgi:hypothetical protein